MGRQAEIALLRLVAQRLAGPRFGSAAEAVGWMTAMQGQDYPGVLSSAALRTQDGTLAGVVKALDAGELVRSWPMRGTLHLTHAQDMPRLLSVTAPRIIAGMAQRRAALDLTLDDMARAADLATRALDGGRSLSRAELLAMWDASGYATDGQRGYHTLAYLGLTGTVCFGPVLGREQALVLLDEWVPDPRRPELDEALGELALRYFRSHGPATVKDFVRWTGLTAADARAGLAIARPELATIEEAGTQYLLDPQTPDLLAQYKKDARRVLLLPGFDEFILGYGDRTAMLPAEFATRIVPGNNGMFKPTVVSAGQVVGTWKRKGAKKTIEAEPFTSFPAAVEKFLAAPR